MTWSACQKRPHAISTRSEALQNPMVSRPGVCRGLCWSFGGGAYYTGPSHTCLGKAVPVEWKGAGLGVSRLGSSVGTVLFPKVGLC